MKIVKDSILSKAIYNFGNNPKNRNKSIIMFDKKVVFRHRDRYVIRKLLIEIGENALNGECWTKKLNKPSNINLFYLETDEQFTYLKYKYPNLGERIIMKLEGYKLPETGWIRCVLR